MTKYRNPSNCTSVSHLPKAALALWSCWQEATRENKQIYPAGSIQLQITIKLELLHRALKTFVFGFLCMQLLTASSV